MSSAPVAIHELSGDNESASRSGMPARGRRLPQTPERTAYPTSKARKGVGCSW